MRKLAKPPHLIMRIMDCVLLLFQRHIDPITQDPERPCHKPSWSEAMKLMSASNFLNGLLSFPKVHFEISLNNLCFIWIFFIYSIFPESEEAFIKNYIFY